MTKKPYTYVMPESFMSDQGVPAHWRLLGILNGFFFNNKDVYASNAWLQEQLGCSQKTISDAVGRLEELGLIVCDRTRTSRVIKRGDSSQLLGGQYPTTIPDSNQLLSNSDSNSDNKKAETKVSVPLEGNSITTDVDYEIVSDTPPKEKKERKDKGVVALREKLYDMFQKDKGVRPTTTASDYFRILASLKRLKEKEIIEIVEDELDKGKKRTVTEMLSARSVDIYLQDNA